MREALPTGVVTLLFTDIEGSTMLLRELGTEYDSALDEHRRILRDCFTQHRGVEVDTQGDSFLVAFARASDAVAAATNAQQRLAAGPVSVRMGLHTGEPRTTEEGYVGIDVHRAARIGASGHGGQVLLSDSTRALIDASVRDLGRHRLKDLASPEHIYQLEIDGLPAEFPLLRTLEAGRSNLPAATTSFVGREEQLTTIDELLGDPACRVLTLVGPGGAGKTRLALEAARGRIDRYPHGVFQVPLVTVADPELITLAIGGAIGFAIDTMWGPDRPRDDQLIGYLADRSMLLVLDNFEHLLDGADLVARIVAGAPGAQVLVTSRERLGLQAESLLEVPGLQDGGDRLFAERARQSDPAFAIADADRPHVARICRLVEYMPLAIELAAAWISVFSPAELAAEIEKSLDILTAAQRDVPERHRSLRAAFEGSWRLMTEGERDAFSRLSVFRGSFTREACLDVAGIDVRLLAALANKSLVRRAGGGRFELHELLRQYAAEALIAEPDRADAVRERHARHFSVVLRSRVERLRGPEMLPARDELRIDLGNLRDAALWAAEHWPEQDALNFMRDLDAFYMAQGWSEGAQIFERLAEARSSRGDAAWLRARSVLASRLAALNQLDTAETIGLDTLAALGDAGDPWDIGQCLLALGTNAANRDEYEKSVRLLLAARANAIRTTDPHLICWVGVWLGWAEIFTGDLAAAREHFDEAFEAARSTGNETLRAYSLSKLGLLADEHHDYATGLRYHLDTHTSFERSGDRPGTGYAMSRASFSAYGLGDYEAALRYGRAGLEAFTEISHVWGITGTTCRIGFAEIGLGDQAGARRTFTDALSQARAAQLGALAVMAGIGLGIVLAREGELSRAATMFLAALDIEGLPGIYREPAKAELESISVRLTPEELAAAREKAAQSGTDGAIEEMLSTRVVS